MELALVSDAVTVAVHLLADQWNSTAIAVAATDMDNNNNINSALFSRFLHDINSTIGYLRRAEFYVLVVSAASYLTRSIVLVAD